MLQRFLNNEREMRALCTIAIHILSIILMLFYRIVEHLFSLIDLHANFGQKSKFERCAIFVNKRLNIYPIELQGIIIVYSESFLRKMESLVYEISISIIHLRPW